ncbi:hypothetical protein BJ508DRAFT_300573 [Ascobolus immersus RN42]|uniref:Uncharacterized protein n=1 Tax=Ascobolus immersus RN42 TaxID=1160509 RepID=A0A3N4IPU4_ASCIM|nr:hypothetical protein BJ508DRAFT_300573 [Ascobolus immersus RN42]
MAYAPPKRNPASPLSNGSMNASSNADLPSKPGLSRTPTSTATANAAVTFDSLGIPPAVDDEPKKPTIARRGSSWLRGKGRDGFNMGKGNDSATGVGALGPDSEVHLGEGGSNHANEETSGDGEKKKKKVRWGVARVMGKLLPKELKDK